MEIGKGDLEVGRDWLWMARKEKRSRRDAEIRGGLLLVHLEGVVEPVVDAGEGHAVGADLAVGAGAFCVGEVDHGFGASEVIVKGLGLALEEHVAFGVEDERGAGDLFGDAVT